MPREPLSILLAEDDEGHAYLIQKNLRRLGLTDSIIHVTNAATRQIVRSMDPAIAGRIMPAGCRFRGVRGVGSGQRGCSPAGTRERDRHIEPRQRQVPLQDSGPPASSLVLSSHQSPPGIATIPDAALAKTTADPYLSGRQYND